MLNLPDSVIQKLYTYINIVKNMSTEKFDDTMKELSTIYSITPISKQLFIKLLPDYDNYADKITTKTKTNILENPDVNDTLNIDNIKNNIKVMENRYNNDNTLSNNTKLVLKDRINTYKIYLKLKTLETQTDGLHPTIYLFENIISELVDVIHNKQSEFDIVNNSNVSVGTIYDDVIKYGRSLITASVFRNNDINTILTQLKNKENISELGLYRGAAVAFSKIIKDAPDIKNILGDELYDNIINLINSVKTYAIDVKSDNIKNVDTNNKEKQSSDNKNTKLKIKNITGTTVVLYDDNENIYKIDVDDITDDGYVLHNTNIIGKIPKLELGGDIDDNPYVIDVDTYNKYHINPENIDEYGFVLYKGKIIGKLDDSDIYNLKNMASSDDINDLIDENSSSEEYEND